MVDEIDTATPSASEDPSSERFLHFTSLLAGEESGAEEGGEEGRNEKEKGRRVVDLQALRAAAKGGVPADLRAVVWKLLLGFVLRVLPCMHPRHRLRLRTHRYLPPDTGDFFDVLREKRATYSSYVEKMYPTDSAL